MVAHRRRQRPGGEHEVQYETILRRPVLPAVIGPAGSSLFSPGLVGRRLVRLRGIDLQEWLAALAAAGRGGSTIRTARTIAGMVLDSATRSGVVGSNPLTGVRITTHTGTSARKVITPERVEALADALATGRRGYRELILLLAYGGLRPSEAFALRRHHLLESGSVLVAEGLVEVRGHLVTTDGKTHRSTTVVLRASVEPELREYVARHVGGDGDALLFTATGDRPLGLRNFRRLFSEVVESLGLPGWVTPYTLRHASASLLARQGVHPTVAADILGHDPAVYLRPTHTSTPGTGPGPRRPWPQPGRGPPPPTTPRRRSRPLEPDRRAGKTRGRASRARNEPGRTPAHLRFCVGLGRFELPTS